MRDESYVVQEEKVRKQEAVKRQAMAGNTKEAQQRLAELSAGPSTATKHLAHASQQNVAMKQPTKTVSSALFEKARFSPLCIFV